MKIEQLIKEMHTHFCKGETLEFAKKLEYALEWADKIAAIRSSIESRNLVTDSVSDYETELMRLGETVLMEGLG